MDCQPGEGRVRISVLLRLCGAEYSAAIRERRVLRG